MIFICSYFSLTPREFNSYGSRRGNDAVMARGTFANIRLVNKFIGKAGPRTIHIPSGEEVCLSLNFRCFYNKINMYICRFSKDIFSIYCKGNLLHSINVFHLLTVPYWLPNLKCNHLAQVFPTLGPRGTFLGAREQYENCDRIKLNFISPAVHTYNYLAHINRNLSIKCLCPIATDTITLFRTSDNWIRKDESLNRPWRLLHIG